MITIFDARATDFSTLGLGALYPSVCEIQEQAGGMYSLEMEHPFDRAGKWKLLTVGRILRAPAPVREAPVTEEAGSQNVTVNREIYKVYNVTSSLRLRQKAGTSGAILGSYKAGTEVAKLEDAGSADGHTWYRVTVLKGGATGYMAATYLQYVRTDTETIQNDTPGGVVLPAQARMQLFRICEVEKDTEQNLVRVQAKHIFYDTAGNVIGSAYAPDGIAANEAVAQISGKLINENPFSLHCSATEPVEGDFFGMSLAEALLDGERGIVGQADGRLVRDNFDIWILPQAQRNSGVSIRHGKNLLGAVLTTDTHGVVTRILPTGKDENGEILTLEGNYPYINSSHIDEYPVVWAKTIEYPEVRISNEMTAEQAQAKLRELAQAEFDSGIDLPNVKLDVDFLALENTKEYARYAGLQVLHLYDLAQIVAPEAGISATLRMTGYTWDAIRERYNRITMGEITEIATVYGDEIGGGISGGKILPGSLDGGSLRDLTVNYAKIGTAAIEQLAADAITAVRADIRKLVAEEITTDQLYADLATIAAACITTANIQNANIDWAQIENLTAAIASIAKAQITTANIGEANIEWAEIENLSAFIVTTAKAQITTANIQNANIDWAQVSTLMAEVATVAKAQITTANIQNANIDWASIATLSAVMADIADARIGSATISTAQIDQLEAEVARILSVQIATGEFDFASVQNLVASAMVLEQGTGGSIYITNLAVTSATILSATMGELVVQGEDGKYYEITVMTDGTIATKEVTVTEGEIAAGETAGGKGIVATTANVAELNAQTVKANSAIISEILVGALTAEKITAQQALIASATVPELYATSIKAIGDSLDLSSNQSIRLYVAGEIEDVQAGVDANAENISGLAAWKSEAELRLTDSAIVASVRQSAEYQQDQQNTADRITELENAVSEQSAELAVLPGQIQGKVSRDELEKYFDFTAEDGLVIGEGGSTLKTIIAPAEMRFEENGRPVLILRESRAILADAEISGSMILGGVYMRYNPDTGHFSILRA